MENRRKSDKEPKMDPNHLRYIKQERKTGLISSVLGAAGALSSASFLAYDTGRMISHNNLNFTPSLLLETSVLGLSALVLGMGMGALFKSREMSRYRTFDEYERSRDDPSYIH